MLLNFTLCVSCYLIYFLLHVTNCYVYVVSIDFTISGGTAAARRIAEDYWGGEFFKGKHVIKCC